MSLPRLTRPDCSSWGYPMSDPLKVYVIAGEPSGDRLGAELIEGLNASADVALRGIGGPLTEAAGLQSQFPMSDLAVMGLLEVLPRLPKLFWRKREVVEAILAWEPDIVVTIDSPDFCLRVARQVRSGNSRIKIAHYVAPSVWAWRPDRAEKMAEYVDHVLALLPFEPPYMEAAGMSCDFVGHPIAAEKPLTKDEIDRFAKPHRGARLVAMLPGSRSGEVKRMLPLYMDVLDRLAPDFPQLRAVIPTVLGSEKDVKALTGDWPIPVTYVDQSSEAHWERQKQIAIAACDAALLTSGTISLEVAAAGTAQIVAYKANRSTEKMMKKMARIDTATLVNILTKTRDVPEFLFKNAEADQILMTLRPILSKEPKASIQLDTARKAIAMLQPPEPHAAAKSILRFVEGSSDAAR